MSAWNYLVRKARLDTSIDISYDDAGILMYSYLSIAVLFEETPRLCGMSS